MKRVDEYGQLAKSYDKQIRDKLTREMYKEWRIELELALTRYRVNKTALVDLGCGTGITTIPWVNRFDRVIGVEISKPMLDVAKKKSSKVKWLNQDMVHLKIIEKADAVTCHFDVLNHILKKKDFQKVLNKVYGLLNDNGLFIFDTITPESEEWLKKRGRKDDISERAYPKGEVKEMLVKSGFKVIKIRKQRTPEWDGKPRRLIFLAKKE